MLRDILFIIFGYLMGSVLFAKVFGILFTGEDITAGTDDGNPGASNAYKKGGFWCGTATLICDILKGAVPVFMYCRGTVTPALALVVAAPVLGHAFPLFYSFHGGKGIASTFGTLLGLAPQLLAVLLLAFWFVFFSVILRVDPHSHRTFITYIFTDVSLLLAGLTYIWIGFSLIFAAVSIRLIKSREPKERTEVKLLWTR